MNTKIAALLAASAFMQACSSVSKETYAETRTLTYPKGGQPHIKDMYMDTKPPEPDQPDAYVGAKPEAEPVLIADDSASLFAPVPELPQAPTNHEAQIQQIEAENDLLLAKAYNKWLRARQ